MSSIEIQDLFHILLEYLSFNSRNMGIFSKLMGGFLQTKEEKTMKAKKIIEIKESRIKEGRNLEKGLDEFVDFLDEYEEVWIDVEDQIECYKRTVAPATEWLMNCKNIIGTYGIDEINLGGYEDFDDKYHLIATYINYKTKITKCRLDFVSEKEIRSNLEMKVEEFDGNGFEEFEDLGFDSLTKAFQSCVDLSKYKTEIENIGKDGKCNTRYKEVITRRLLKEGLDSLNIDKEFSDSGIVNRLNEKYAEKKRSIDKDWQPKSFKL